MSREEVFWHNLEIAKKEIGGALALADFLGCHYGTVSNWLYEPPIYNHSKYVAALASYLGVKYEDLFTVKVSLINQSSSEAFWHNLEIAKKEIGGALALAKFLGCHRRTVSNWLSEPPIHNYSIHASILADYLGISYIDLFTVKQSLTVSVFKHNLNVAIAKAGSQVNLAKVLQCSKQMITILKNGRTISACKEKLLADFLGVEDLFAYKLTENYDVQRSVFT